MIDFHSHILPGIDDGSKDADMSLQMLKALKTQGAGVVCATSHFYATERTPERFLFRRQEAYEKLCAQLPPDAPEILLGAEILYFPGIGRMEALPSLCLEGTNLLLLEMPFERWSDYMVREVMDLARSRRFTLLMAHIERYYDAQAVSVWDDLLDCGVLMQSNADFFLGLLRRRKALRLLAEGRIHLLGSDCHNIDSRAPRMKEARAVIEKQLGREVLTEIDDLGRRILREGSL